MHLEYLETVSFRNLAEQHITLHHGLNVISGDNAQGKSNLLEAALMLTGLNSLRRGVRSQEMIRFGEQSAALRGCVQAHELRRSLEVQLTGSGRRARVDGKAARSSASYLEGMGVVTFTPEELAVPRGGPGPRRRMLDQAVTGQWPACAALLRDLQKVVSSRNRLLVQLDGGGQGGRRSSAREMLEVYDQRLAEIGARVLAARVRYLARIEPLFCQTYTEICRGDDRAGLAYRSTPAVKEAGDRIASLTMALADDLRNGIKQDMARKATLRGPHTDDMEFLVDGKSTRSFGSQGQVRALVLALKVAQIIDTRSMLGDYPILLLDDVSSELDRNRNQYLFEFISKISCQTLLTTTRPEILEVSEECKRFQVVNGIVTCKAPS